MASRHDWQLAVPDQLLKRLSIGSDNPKKLKAWADALPPINLGESAHQLYQFIQEFNQYQLHYKKRLPLLEIILPYVTHITASLGKHYLNRPLILPEKSRRVASLAQALHGHLANGYKLVALDGLEKIRDKDTRKMVALACTRATDLLGDALLRSHQLYFPVPNKLWLEIHQLYWLCEYHKIENVSTDNSATPRAAYLRTLLLATSRPNQLRQQELRQVYDAALEWTQFVDLTQDLNDNSIFATELNMDRAPIYASNVPTQHQGVRYLDTRPLVQHLSQQNQGLKGNAAENLSDPLLVHLRHAWISPAERSFQRIKQDGELELCLGPRDAHFFVSGKVHFKQFVSRFRPQSISLDETNLNPYVKQQAKSISNDPWSQTLSPQATALGNSVDFSSITNSLIKSNTKDPGEHKVYKVKKENASPGGYCLNWQSETPLQLRAGELVALRDGDPDWALAIIRWVRQSNKGVQFGVEVMAPRAEACAAKTVRKQGDESDLLRAFLLPAMDAIQQPISLLLPAVGFQTGQKVDLFQQNTSTRIVLTEQISGTASFRLFMYQNETTQQEAPDTSPTTDHDQDPFDSIWLNL